MLREYYYGGNGEYFDGQHHYARRRYPGRGDWTYREWSRMNNLILNVTGNSYSSSSNNNSNNSSNNSNGNRADTIPSNNHNNSSHSRNSNNGNNNHNNNRNRSNNDNVSRSNTWRTMSMDRLNRRRSDISLMRRNAMDWDQSINEEEIPQLRETIGRNNEIQRGEAQGTQEQPGQEGERRRDQEEGQQGEQVQQTNNNVNNENGENEFIISRTQDVTQDDDFIVAEPMEGTEDRQFELNSGNDNNEAMDSSTVPSHLDDESIIIPNNEIRSIPSISSNSLSSSLPIPSLSTAPPSPRHQPPSPSQSQSQEQQQQRSGIESQDHLQRPRRYSTLTHFWNRVKFFTLRRSKHFNLVDTSPQVSAETLGRRHQS